LAEQAPVSFAQLLKRLRTEAGLTQEGLAEAASLSTRSVSDLERGINLTARRETARLLADALNLAGPARAGFEAAARGGAPAGLLREPGIRPVGLAAATRTMPRDITVFTGRDYELAQLAQAVASSVGSGGVVGIHAIGGMAGIGKTAFAVHAAHRLAPRFPDGQIFLPLYGHTPGQRPVDPADALASLLQTTGVDVQQIPAGLEARTRLWRNQLVGKRLLLVLDDAVGHDQVRPLLPSTPGSLVLVTSRRRLMALEDAQAISLDVLPTDEAAELLIRLAGRPGLHSDDAAVSEVIQLCGYLPLAIGMLARQLHHHPSWTAADLADDLALARDRLELMAAENLSVAAAFDLSYQDLTADEQRLFRRLGLHPGADIDVFASAALDDSDLNDVRRRLDALYDQHLIAEPVRGRYRLHDLIREHARALAASDPVADSDAAIGRLLDYYLHTARAADRYLARRTPAGVPSVSAIPTAHAPDFADRESAVAWMDAERLNLHAVAVNAQLHYGSSHAIAIATTMHAFLSSQGHWDQALTLHRAALNAAQRVGDQLAEACILTDLGDIQRMTGDYRSSRASLEQALELYRSVGDRLGEANALHYLGVMQQATEDYPASRTSLEQALELYRSVGDRLGDTGTLIELGAVQRLTGDYSAATASLTSALELSRDFGDKLGEATALTELGAVQYLTEDYSSAITVLNRAMELHHDLGNRQGEANALYHMGAVQYLTEDYLAAGASLEQALGLDRDLGNRSGEANALNYLAAVQQATGDHPAAVASLERALELYRSLGHRPGEPVSPSKTSELSHRLRPAEEESAGAHDQSDSAGTQPIMPPQRRPLWQAFTDGVGGIFDLFGGTRRNGLVLPSFGTALADDAHALCLILGLVSENEHGDEDGRDR